MMMMGHSLAPSRLKMRDLLAAFASFLHSADWSKSCLGGECRYNGRSEKQDYPFLFVDKKKMRRKSVTKVLLGHFQAYFFLCLLYLCFVFKGLKSYYIFCRKHYYVAISMQLWYYTQYTIFLYRCMRYLYDSETI